MRKANRHNRSPVERLRLAIDCMPLATREAMLAALASSARIIVGAYTDGQGGMCPMLAAHRAGGRTDCLAFAKSWDRFTRAGGKSRVATSRELAVLRAQLEASIAAASKLEFDEAIREHHALIACNRHTGVRLPDQADPTGEIIARRLRPSRRSRVRGERAHTHAPSRRRVELAARR